MRKIKKRVFFIIVACIAVFTCLTFFGISTQYGDVKTTYIRGVDGIRWGIDIRGGVDVTFTPPEGVEATESQMDAARAVIEQRMISLGITDYELYVDYANYHLIVRFPWQAGEADFDPEQAVKELGETAELTFRKGYEVDSVGLPTGETAENIIITGADVESAQAVWWEENGKQNFAVSLTLLDSGKEKFAEATTELAETNGIISIWMDDTCISYPNVEEPLTDGQAQITSSTFTWESAKALADKINSGALPFKLTTANYRTISPTLGEGARDAMPIAGVIAFIAIAVYVIAIYRLPGVVAVIALFGQVVASIAAVTGFFAFIPSFTLTIPGIAGIILAVGMGVDANVITAERIREEINNGKSLNSALELGYKRAWAAIFDGNITIVFVAVILMGAFGPPDSIFAQALRFLFFMFPASTAGTIYSFGYTLLMGVLFNFFFGVLCSRLMLAALSKFKAFRNVKLYGGVDNE